MSRHIVIIGAGVIGIMCAIESLRAGLQVTLLDPGPIAGEQAASYGNAGWLSPHLVTPPLEPGVWKKVPGYLMDPLGPLAIRPAYLSTAFPWLWRYMSATATPQRVEKIAVGLKDMLHDAHRLHQHVAQEAGLGQFIQADSGVTHVYRSRQQFEADSLGWRIRRQLGMAFQELTEAELRNQQPHLNHDYRFGVFVPGAGYCSNPGAYVAGLGQHAVANGAKLVSGKATGFELEGNRLKAVAYEGGKIICDAAVIAAGAHSKPLAQAVGTKVLLETERGYHVTIDSDAANRIGPTHTITVPDKKLIVTMMEQGPRVAGQVELAGLTAPPNWRRADVLKTILHDLFPTLPSYPKERYHYWMGHRPSSADGKPYVGHASATRDVLLAFGHGHNGLMSSAKTGRLIAQLLVGAEPEIPLESFAPQRFM